MDLGGWLGALASKSTRRYSGTARSTKQSCTTSRRIISASWVFRLVLGSSS